jgi:hypothetical protein
MYLNLKESSLLILQKDAFYVLRYTSDQNFNSVEELTSLDNVIIPIFLKKVFI